MTIENAPPSETFDEAQRLDILGAHDVARAAGDTALTSITDLAAKLCDVPIALVSLVEDYRQWFPARFGLDATETPRNTSFCAHAMLGTDIMIVADAATDPRFADNALVTGEPFIRFYAGAPLLSAEGAPLGALCVIDRQPRDGLSPMQAQGLRVLADHVMVRLGMLRSKKAQRHSDVQVRAELLHHEQKFQIIADTMPQMVWATRPDGYHDYYNARWYEFTGTPPGSTDGEGWNGMFHPDDQQRAWTDWHRSLTTGDPYEIEYRLRTANGEYRWVLGRALPMRGEDGAIIRWFGTCTDIHDHRMLMEQREIISHELSHRIKNIFSVVGGLIGLSTRERPEFGPIARDLRERVMALGRAHDFVRPHSDASRPLREQTSLHGLIDELLMPYQAEDGSRITVRGADVRIDDRAATPLALLWHELATNAAKYGGLSTDTGRVHIDIAETGDQLRITWMETGGPAVTAPKTDGFGTRLIEMSAIRQLGGTIERDWKPDGLALTLDVPRSSMNRPKDAT